MILPGTASDDVRGLPWVTFAVMLVSAVVLFASGDAPVAEAPELPAPLAEAADYWRSHAYLIAEPEVLIEVGRDLPADERRAQLEQLRHESFKYWPADKATRKAQQAELDRLTQAALARAPATSDPAPDPRARWGLGPGSASALALFTHAFVHRGWIHLVGNLALLFLAGAALEARWKPLIFGPFCALAALASGGVFALASSGSTAPLIGSSGLVAAVIAGTLVRHASSPISFRYLAWSKRRLAAGSFHAPAWWLALAWLANEGLQTWSAGLDTGGTYWAQAGGLIFGLGVAVAIRDLRIEERLVGGETPDPLTPARRNPLIAKALRACDERRFDDAFALLESQIGTSPEDPEVVLAFWHVATTAERPQAGAPAMLRLVRDCVRRGEMAAAARHWVQVVERAPRALAEPATLIRLAAALVKLEQKQLAIRALQHALDRRNKGLTESEALRAVAVARELGSATAVGAARRALQFPDLGESVRAPLLELVSGGGPAAAPSPAKAEPSAPTPVEPEQDELEEILPDEADVALDAAPDPEPLEVGPIAVEPLAVEPLEGEPLEAELEDEEAGAPAEQEALVLPEAEPRFSGIKVLEGAPERLGDAGLTLRLSEGRCIDVEWSKVQALAAAAIRPAPGAPPLVVVDLALNWTELSEGPLRVVRMRSDAFDPRTLAGDVVSLAEAWRVFLQELLRLSEAAPLPDLQSARGEPMPVFQDLETYQRDVLEVGA